MLLLFLLTIGCSDNIPNEEILKTNVAEDKTFIETLPQNLTSKVLWYSDFEDSSFKKWEDEGTGHQFAGGGIFNTDEVNSSFGIENEIVHSGNHASFAKIQNVITPMEPKAIRLMRWTDKAWDNQGNYFPDEAYYSAFFYFPENYSSKKPSDNDPLNDGGWWNIFQFKSDNNAGSQPIAVLDVYNKNGNMYLGLIIKEYVNDDTTEHTQTYLEQTNPIALAVGEWLHIEAYYKKAADDSGAISIWQKGKLILEKKGFKTLFSEDGTAVWGIGNYTDYIVGGEAIIYFDDAIVATSRIGAFLE